MDSIYNLSRKGLEDRLIENDYKKFNATQLFEWIYEKQVADFSLMTNLKKELIGYLKNNFALSTMELVEVEEDEDVNKYLFRLEDNQLIEAVLMYHDYGNSLCISSQVGCNMGCAFCESGRRKKVRNLTSGEMVEQILLVEQHIKKRITHVVIMGIGEPFDNYDNVTRFIETVNDPKGLALGSRHITVSTCGIVPKIKEFADFPYQVNLAISLHAPNDSLRKSLMPIAKVYPLKELMEALVEYYNKTKRRLTFEYILLEGINDSEENAIELSKLLKGINGYVNLIPYNETSHIKFHKTKPIQIMKFYDILKKNNIPVTIRREFGSKISAACGQLRSAKEEE